jgi:NADH-quinone oxidoreductase subunit M
MDNLLSIITFLPLVAALILALLPAGDDAAAQKNAKWLALIATTRRPSSSRSSCCGFDPRTPASSSSRSGPGFSA